MRPNRYFGIFLVIILTGFITSLSFAQPRIDRGVRPEPRVTIPDDPRIQEFSANPASVLVGGRLTLRWRVEPGPVNSSPINRISITSSSLRINLSSTEASGESSVVIPSRATPDRYQITLVATDQVGRQSSRSVDIQVTADEPIIHEFSADPSIVLEGYTPHINFRWRIEVPSGGSPLERIRITRGSLEVHSSSSATGEYRYERIRGAGPLEPGIEQFTLTVSNRVGRSTGRTINVEVKSLEFVRDRITSFRLTMTPNVVTRADTASFRISFNNGSGLTVWNSRIVMLQGPHGGFVDERLLVIRPGNNEFTLTGSFPTEDERARPLIIRITLFGARFGGLTLEHAYELDIRTMMAFRIDRQLY